MSDHFDGLENFNTVEQVVAEKKKKHLRPYNEGNKINQRATSQAGETRQLSPQL